MANDFGDDVSSTLLRETTRLLENLIREWLRNSNSFQQNKQDNQQVQNQEDLTDVDNLDDVGINGDTSNIDLVAIPFGSAEDSLEFAEYCNDRNIFAMPFEDKDSNGYLVLDRNEEALKSEFLHEYFDGSMQDKIDRIVSSLEHVVPLTQEQMDLLTPIGEFADLNQDKDVTQDISDDEVLENTESEVQSSKTPNKTEALAQDVDSISYYVHENFEENEFSDFLEQLHEKNIGITLNKKGEYMFYRLGDDAKNIKGHESGRVFPIYEKGRDWAVNAGTLANKYNVFQNVGDTDKFKDFLSNQLRLAGEKSQLAEAQQQVQNQSKVQEHTNSQRHTQAVQAEQAFVVTDGSLDADGRTPDADQGIESHDGMDTNTNTRRIEREQTNSDVAPSDIRKEEDYSIHDEYSLESKMNDSRHACESLSAQEHSINDISKFVEPSR